MSLKRVLGDNSLLSLLGTTAVVVLLGSLARQYRRSPWRKLPPGPKGLPFLGNLFQLGSKQWLSFSDMRTTFGDLIYLDAAGQPIVVINSQKVAADLLDRHSSKTSGRPRLIVAEVLTGGKVLVFLSYTKLWKRIRKATHEGFNRTISKGYRPVQHLEAMLLSSALISRPQSWNAHFRRNAASSLMAVVYGTSPVTTDNDSSVTSVNDHVSRLTRANLPGAHLVEFMPWLRHFPSSISKWKRVSEQWYEHDSKMFEDLLGSVRTRMAKGDTRLNFCVRLFEGEAQSGLSESEKAWTAGTMYAAGAETTSAVMSWFLLAMTAFRDVQRRAQTELDTVVGRSRPPTFDDFDHLPFIRAILKEVLRWRPVDPVGLAHSTTEDDWYGGFFIPSGTIIIPNVWQMNRDPNVYGNDAAKFDPSRHLDEQGNLKATSVYAKDEGHVSYGFGRRICVGRHVANNSLFINMAMVLWAMDISEGTGGNIDALPLGVDACVEDGIVVRPASFNCHIQPRFAQAPVLLTHALEGLLVN